MTAPTPPKPFIPNDAEVHIWCIDLDDTSISLASAAAALSAEERERAERFATDKLRRRYVLAHAALRGILSLYIYKCEPGLELLIQTGESGKPYLPAHEETLSFNLSHSRRYALVAVANGRAVGVDIESTAREVDQQALAQRFFSAEEAQQLSSSDDSLAFFRLWTRKEAFVKATGHGLSFPLDQFNVDCEASSGNLLLNVSNGLTESGVWQLKSVPAPDDYVAAVAACGDLQVIKHYSYEFD